MLFTSTTFVLLFLPAVLAGFFVLGRWRPNAAAAWLFAASLFFYGWWMPAFTLLLLASIGGNFLIGRAIAAGTRPLTPRAWMLAGVAGNLLLLGYFKYANFFVDNLNALLGSHWAPVRVVLPVGISFYCFTQIAFLVDSYQRKVVEGQPIHYGLFVTYFPHLVAGPVLHHAQMMPQFANAAIYRFNAAHFTGGLLIFCIGLFKKIVLADGVAPYADAVFKPVDGGQVPTFAEAWLGASAYTLQLYFDFSGYSDMAIGLSWMFNVQLPFNFNSPYQSTSISDFWRRWHISLSTFLRDYLYITLGGNRQGPVRRYLNLAATMVLGGLWHGANWSFVLWGALHGLYLMINHGWRALCGPAVCARLDRLRSWTLLSWALTLLAVVVAWVFFRAENLGGASRMVQAMASPPAQPAPANLLWNAGLQATVGWGWCAVLGLLAFLAPNSNRLGSHALALAQARPRLRALLLGAALCLALLLVVMNAAREGVSAFIYFNF